MRGSCRAEDGRDMKEQIIARLRELEEKENIKILLAVESGSRAWGFESPDSDYDVRFIYVRNKDDYLCLEEPRDVIELPIEGDLDINGWDLRKALRLLYKCNPTLSEWLKSPIVYIESEYADELRELPYEYFSRKGSLYHYLSMAQKTYREHLTGDMVKVKKYFYALRPVLACRWIIDRCVPPPMLFSKLVEAELPEELKEDVEKLLDIKMNSPETKLIPRVDKINEYLEKSMEGLKILADEYPGEKRWYIDGLDAFFLMVLNGEKGCGRDYRYE